MTNLYQNKYKFKQMRLQSWDYSWDGAYFVTVKVENNIKCLGKVVNGKVQLSKFGDIVKKHWTDSLEHYSVCRSDEFAIMPDHFHGIVIIHSGRNGFNNPVGQFMNCPTGVYKNVNNYRIYRRNMLLAKIIGRFKMQSAKEINILKDISGQKFWQFRFRDRVIRNEKELNHYREYIRNNPIAFQEKLDVVRVKK